MQRKHLDIIPLESDSHVWSRIMTSLPAGQLSFIIRAGIDCLPTPMTLCRWKYRTDSKCNLCGTPQCTTNHILNCCPTSLFQGRYTWRHDSVLSRLLRLLRSNLDDNSSVYVDLDGLRASDSPPSTVPLDILVTSARPDVVIIDDRIIELTIPANNATSLGNARARKQQKGNYVALVIDLQLRGYSVIFDTVEIGALGHYTSSSVNAIHQIIPHVSKASVGKCLTTR